MPVHTDEVTVAGEGRPGVDIGVLIPFLVNIRSGTEADLIFLPQSDKRLYHYTDLAGLKGIVENHDLWLTNSRYSNAVTSCAFSKS